MGGFMQKGNVSGSSVSLAKGSKGRYVIQDMKDCGNKQADIMLMTKSEDGKKSGEEWYTPDLLKVQFKK
jgi:hypothetical protein